MRKGAEEADDLTGTVLVGIQIEEADDPKVAGRSFKVCLVF